MLVISVYNFSEWLGGPPLALGAPPSRVPPLMPTTLDSPRATVIHTFFEFGGEPLSGDDRSVVCDCPQTIASYVRSRIASFGRSYYGHQIVPHGNVRGFKSDIQSSLTFFDSLHAFFILGTFDFHKNVVMVFVIPGTF